MASNIPSDNPTCPVCFESQPVVKMLSTCKHVFCRSCLSAHLQTSNPESTSVITCPTCQVESPLPENGVDGLVNYTKDGAADEVVQGAVGGDDVSRDPEEREDEQLCMSCQFTTSTNVRAENLCEECGSLFLCGDCTEVHRRNPATRRHVVMQVKYLEKEGGLKCQPHDQLMKSYCSTCSKPVCHLCILLEHGDHVIMKISEKFQNLLRRTTDIASENKQKTQDLRKVEEDMKELLHAVVAERDTLVKAIEDHAEVCIEKILNQKKALKAQVHADYDMIEGGTTLLELLPDTAREMDSLLRRTHKLLSGKDLCPSNHEMLTSIEQSLTTSAILVDDLVKQGHENAGSYVQLQGIQPTFKPIFKNPSIGRMIYTNETPQARQLRLSRVSANPQDQAAIEQRATGPMGSSILAPRGLPRSPIASAEPLHQLRDVRQCRLVLETIYQKPAHETWPHKDVASLRHGFAVVSPSMRQLNIYNLLGRLIRRILPLPGPITGLASTLGGDLTALSEDCRQLYTFNSENDHIESSRVYYQNRSAEGVSFDITACPLLGAQQQLVILNGDNIVCLANMDYNPDFYQSFTAQRKVKGGAKRIACGGNVVYIAGGVYVDAYELDLRRRPHLVFIARSQPLSVFDISATPFGEVTVLCKRKSHCNLGRATFRDGRFSKWHFKEIDQEVVPPIGNFPAALSVRGNHIVTSIKGTVRVFVEEEK